LFVVDGGGVVEVDNDDDGVANDIVEIWSDERCREKVIHWSISRRLFAFQTLVNRPTS
jgi:hypothetical protein